MTVAAGADVNLTASLTIEAWVYPTTLTGWRTVIIKENGSGLAYALLCARQRSATGGVACTSRARASTAISAGTVQLPLNTWTHLAATFDGTSLRLHVGGVLI